MPAKLLSTSCRALWPRTSWRRLCPVSSTRRDLERNFRGGQRDSVHRCGSEGRESRVDDLGHRGIRISVRQRYARGTGRGPLTVAGVAGAVGSLPGVVTALDEDGEDHPHLAMTHDGAPALHRGTDHAHLEDCALAGCQARGPLPGESEVVGRRRVVVHDLDDELIPGGQPERAA